VADGDLANLKIHRREKISRHRSFDIARVVASRRQTTSPSWISTTKGLRMRRRNRAERPRLFRTHLLETALLISLSVGIEAAAHHPAYAQSQQRSFSVPAGPLSSALAVFGRQAGLQVSYRPEIASGKQSAGVSGSLTSSEALSRLLAGTGLIYDVSGNVVTIEDRFAAATPAEADGSLPLDVIEVTAGALPSSGSGFEGTPDWVYETPGSVSVISSEAIKSDPSRNARELFDSVAGVWANQTDIQNPGININIRGLYDNGRVPTMIDGARQNFQRLGHYTYQRSYVDTSFIREVDIEKSGTSGVNGAASLGGYVDFRTINADDLIEPGKQFGGEIDLGTGTNEYNFDGSASVAFRPSDSFSILGGISNKNVGEYAIGKNGDLGSLAPDHPTFAGAETWSGLVKAEADLTDDLKLTLSWLGYKADANEGTLNEDSISYGAYAQDIVNNTATATLAWNPASDMIDLEARLWVNHLTNNETFEGNDYFVATDTDYTFTTPGISLQNTSRFYPSFGEIALNYGFEAFRDIGKSVASNELIDADPDIASGYGGNNGTATRDIVSGFANATLEHDDWLTLSGGLRYDWYRMDGDTTWYDQYQVTVCTAYLFSDWLGIPTPPEDDICVEFRNDTYHTGYDEHVDHSDGALLPTAMVAVKPFDWLQPFVKYSQTFRPPTITESLFAGGHPGTTAGTEWAPNPDLKPETARTWEIGANISHDGVFTEDDSVRMKIVAFSRDIEDYILLGEFQRPETTRTYTSFVNVDGMTHTEGLEFEGSYDAGTFYVGGSFTLLNIDWSNVEAQDLDGSLDANSFFAPPGRKFTIDAGVRLVDRKLTLGGRVTNVAITQEDSEILTTTPEKYAYTVFDLYGSYDLNESATLRFSVDNVTDLAYVPTLGLVTHPAPGRTATVSLDLKF
jgi:hemoglobin/transferrin/lactoferrin receptor protein